MNKKTLAYIALGGAAIVGVYWFYKNAMKESAQKTLSGGLSGFGGKAKSILGEIPGMDSFMGKGESKRASAAVRARPSVTPPHSTPITGTGSNTFFPKRDLKSMPPASAGRRTSRVGTMTPSAGGGVQDLKPTSVRKPAVGTPVQTAVQSRPASVGYRPPSTPINRQSRPAVTTRSRTHKPAGARSRRTMYGGR